VKILNRAGDADRIFHRTIVTKVKFGNLPHSHSRLEVMADKTGGASQRRQIRISFVIGAEDAYINARNPKIMRHFYMGDTHKSDAGILDLPADDIDKFLLEKLADLARSSTHSSDPTGRRRA
jgi:hypothetical protein